MSSSVQTLHCAENCYGGIPLAWSAWRRDYFEIRIKRCLTGPFYEIVMVAKNSSLLAFLVAEIRAGLYGDGVSSEDNSSPHSGRLQEKLQAPGKTWLSGVLLRKPRFAQRRLQVHTEID